ncbi:hypothetical protein HUT19_00620 [Streptomyces sp. NA02950]|uniref:hypothetical protein n=1 Tax=Streptomyces sp. NA02950 TaxID=2742137 RepID=UPI00159089B4|nr:hypothetical protein [Streptomyces sp. NA02950]QKV90471.1 hypothetical protein HUT19_00620 [Streptomyces sp. NA02950]
MSADLSTLDKIATKWEVVHGKIEKLPNRIRDEVLKPLKDKGYWEGAAAPYAWTQIDDIQRQVAGAVKVASAVAKVLKDGAGELRTARKELREAVARAKKKGLHVDGDGQVSGKVGGSSDVTTRDVDDAQDEIIDILRKAYLVDENLSIALMYDVGIDEWFNTKPRLTDVNHNLSLSIPQFNAANLALDGKEAHPKRNNADPYDMGLDWLGNSGPEHQDFTYGDKFTELIQRSDSMEDVRKQTMDKWRQGHGTGTAGYSIAKDGYKGAAKKLLSEDLPAIITGDEDGLGQGFTGSYQVHYEVNGVEPDGTIIVKYSLDNETSVSSLLHYVGYHDWLEKLNPSSGPGHTVSQNVTWVERISPDAY